MFFDPARTGEFLQVFGEARERIRSFDGCQHLELLRDVNTPNVYCTYSIWESEEKLNRYRFSDLFKTTWASTKPLFIEKPVAFSLEKVGYP
jgi:heme oxygenase (mycobilin-producing)